MKFSVDKSKEVKELIDMLSPEAKKSYDKVLVCALSVQEQIKGMEDTLKGGEREPRNVIEDRATTSASFMEKQNLSMSENIMTLYSVDTFSILMEMGPVMFVDGKQKMVESKDCVDFIYYIVPLAVSLVSAIDVPDDAKHLDEMAEIVKQGICVDDRFIRFAMGQANNRLKAIHESTMKPSLGSFKKLLSDVGVNIEDVPSGDKDTSEDQTVH